MKAVFPGKADSAHLTEIPEPKITDAPDGRGVLVRILRVGLDGTKGVPGVIKAFVEVAPL